MEGLHSQLLEQSTFFFIDTELDRIAKGADAGKNGVFSWFEKRLSELKVKKKWHNTSKVFQKHKNEYDYLNIIAGLFLAPVALHDTTKNQHFFERRKWWFFYSPTTTFLILHPASARTKFIVIIFSLFFQKAE
ncbi:MAG TPA: hypothetical protein K8V56_12890 [Sporosarcina psychrophila]|uniref:Uncharacterized protein n=1 Tax=Sporosarcina psychrophila TaxID=1476 RepID=A0A921KDZ7_SPOPS|nr:hypothetical protein [Sporosarcina psychrophila]